MDANHIGIETEAVLDLSMSLNPFAPDVAPLVARHAVAVRTYPDDRVATDALAAAIERAVFDQRWAVHAAQAGLDRARSFTWTESARTLHRAYTEAVGRQRA